MRAILRIIGTAALTFTAFATAAADPGTMNSTPAEHGHRQSIAAQGPSRTVANYTIPSVRLTRQDGQVVNLREEIDDGRPVVLAFIYASCSTVCPLISHTLSELQTKLGGARERVHLMSITIDPEQDSPARLRELAKTYGAGPEWQYYTGTLSASETAQRAFDVYRGAKMDHSPVTLIRPAPDGPWVRLDGFTTASQLFAELPDLSNLRAAR